MIDYQGRLRCTDTEKDRYRDRKIQRKIVVHREGKIQRKIVVHREGKIQRKIDT